MVALVMSVLWELEHPCHSAGLMREGPECHQASVPSPQHAFGGLSQPSVL